MGIEPKPAKPTRLKPHAIIARSPRLERCPPGVAGRAGPSAFWVPDDSEDVFVVLTGGRAQIGEQPAGTKFRGREL